MPNLYKQYNEGDKISHHCIYSTKRGMVNSPMSHDNFLISSSLAIHENLPDNNVPSDSDPIEIDLGTTIVLGLSIQVEKIYEDKSCMSTESYRQLESFEFYN